MDWYSWLSKSNLDPTLAYEYGLAFERNELQEEDLIYFNHEFLQSIGISIAKHRLEILKLSNKVVREKRSGFSRIILAINKTKKLFTKNIGKWGSHKNSSQYPISELSPYHRALRKINREKTNEHEKAMMSRNVITRSGPLDRRVEEKLMATHRSLSVSGPLNGKMHERLTYPNWSPMVSPLRTRPTDERSKDRVGFICRSPIISGPIDRWGLSPNFSPFNHYNNREKVRLDDGDQSLWYLMFQDMKPT